MSKDYIEKLHTEMSDIPELSSSDKPLLNSIKEIDKIVRRFASEVIHNAFSGDMKKDEFLAWLERKTTLLNRLFLGEFTSDSDNYRRGVWNKPENLGHYLLLNMGASGECATAVQLLLMNFAGDVIKIMNANKEKGDKAVKNALDEACNEIRNKLMGVEIGVIE